MSRKDHRHECPAGWSIKNLIQDFLSPACTRTIRAVIRVAETPKVVQVQFEVPDGRRNTALPSLLGSGCVGGQVHAHRIGTWPHR